MPRRGLAGAAVLRAPHCHPLAWAWPTRLPLPSASPVTALPSLRVTSSTHAQRGDPGGQVENRVPKVTRTRVPRPGSGWPRWPPAGPVPSRTRNGWGGAQHVRGGPARAGRPSGWPPAPGCGHVAGTSGLGDTRRVASPAANPPPPPPPGRHGDAVALRPACQLGGPCGPRNRQSGPGAARGSSQAGGRRRAAGPGRRRGGSRPAPRGTRPARRGARVSPGCRGPPAPWPARLSEPQRASLALTCRHTGLRCSPTSPPSRGRRAQLGAHRADPAPS